MISPVLEWRWTDGRATEKWQVSKSQYSFKTRAAAVEQMNRWNEVNGPNASKEYRWGLRKFKIEDLKLGDFVTFVNWSKEHDYEHGYGFKEGKSYKVIDASSASGGTRLGVRSGPKSATYYLTYDTGSGTKISSGCVMDIEGCYKYWRKKF